MYLQIEIVRTNMLLSFFQLLKELEFDGSINICMIGKMFIILKKENGRGLYKCIKIIFSKTKIDDTLIFCFF